MNYVKLDFENGVVGYQESTTYGEVTRYVAEDGTDLLDYPHVGCGGVVVDANPPRLDWMV